MIGGVAARRKVRPHTVPVACDFRQALCVPDAPAHAFAEPFSTLERGVRPRCSPARAGVHDAFDVPVPTEAGRPERNDHQVPQPFTAHEISFHVAQALTVANDLAVPWRATLEYGAADPRTGLDD